MIEQVTFNADKNRYEMPVGEEIVFGNITKNGDVVQIDYVEAPESLRGTGAAGRFMQGLMEIARSENFTVIPRCGYAAAWIHRHPDMHDLVAK